MDVDFSVELEAGDDALEFPWASDDGRLRYYDVRTHPDLLLYIDEASAYPELGHFLAALNSPKSVFLTAKCDVWAQDELSEAEEIYGAAMKFCSYVDLLFAADAPEDEDRRFEFERHEQTAQRAVELLGHVPEIAAAAEFIVRRCYYRSVDDSRAGFYLTFYLFGYGDDEEEARKRWGIGLDLARNALLQLSAEVRRSRG